MNSPPEDHSSDRLDVGPAVRGARLGRSPVAFRHDLLGNPLLSLAAVADLADCLDVGSVTCEDPDRPLVYADGAPEPVRTHDVGDLIRSLEENRSWITLLNIEASAAYGALIDTQLDRLAADLSLTSRDLRRRAGFVFASSPGSVTGAHFDVEHSLLLQLRGNRTLSFGEFVDPDTREREIRRYWHGSYGKLTTMPVHLMDFAIGPGEGAYIPPYRPHWLQNGEATSLSLTLTFFTKENETRSLAQAFNERVRRFGISPRPDGISPARDRAKAKVMSTAAAVRGLRRVSPTSK